jgi:transcriptional regulator with XRE-family HTH domain
MVDPLVRDLGIGERIWITRKRRGMSRVDVATLAGHTEEWLRQIETGIRPVDKLSTLIKLAEVLAVHDLTELTGQPFRLAPNGRPMHEAIPTIRLVLARQVLADPSDGEVVDPAELRRRIDHAWTAWHVSHQQVKVVGAVLPALLADAIRAQQGAGDDDRRQACGLLAEVYQLAERWLGTVGEMDLAAQVADRALVMAQLADDPLLVGASAWVTTMASLSAGHPDVAAPTAFDAVRMLAPLLDDDHVGSTALSLWGSLQLVGAIASAFTAQPATAWRHWDQAKDAAQTLGTSHFNRWTTFGMPNVSVYEIAINVETGKARRAVEDSERIDITGMPSAARRAQHMISIARGHHQQRHYEETIGALLAADSYSSDSVAYNLWARELVRDLLRRTRTPNLDLNALSDRMGVLA